MGTDIIEKLDYSRKELLDMGLRGNTMLHFKPNTKSLELTGQHSSEVLKTLVVDNKKFQFLPKGTAPKKQSFVTQFETDPLKTRLRKISREAKSFIEERGMNVLYVALGFLKWFESDSSEIERFSPLILVPVDLERSNVKDSFKLHYNDEEIGPNFTLKEKLKAEFNLTFPTFDDQLNANNYFAEVQKAVSTKNRWEVCADKMALGFFSFGKFQMYKDLDAKLWNGTLDENPVINSLLSMDGFGDTVLEEITGMGNIDTAIKPGDIKLVKDADSSQLLAINKVRGGSHLIIQGPPGTGKSQTITNIIADSIAQNKKVLFVAEKMAALDVVKRRLDECHLGDAVLELHSHKANKKHFTLELGRVLHLHKPSVSPYDHKEKELQELIEYLNTYCEDVNAPIGNTNVSFITAVGFIEKYRKTLEGQNIFELELWGESEYLKRYQVVQEAGEYLKAKGVPTQNPFYGSLLNVFSPGEEHTFTAAFQQPIDSNKVLLEKTKELSDITGIQFPLVRKHIEGYVELIKVLEKKPTLDSVNAKAVEAINSFEDVSTCLHMLEKARNLKDSYKDILIDEAWDYNVLKIRQAYKAHNGKFYKFLIGDFRKAKAEFIGLLEGAYPLNPMKIIDDIRAVKTTNEQYEKQKDTLAKIFKENTDFYSNAEKLISQLTFIKDLSKVISANALPFQVADFLESVREINIDKLPGIRDELDKQTSLFYQKSLALYTKLAWDKEIVTDFSNDCLETTDKALKAMKDDIKALHDTVRANVILKELEDFGLHEIAGLFKNWDKEKGKLLDIFAYSYYNSILNSAYSGKDSINKFDLEKHRRAITRFCRLDKELMIYSQHELALSHWEHIPKLDGPGQMAIIRKEVSKKARHKSVRRLIYEAAEALQDIKPVFMMSPMSVATFLPPGRVEFDIVIFDEASQVKTVDALGAIARGRQIVVVGDDKQMPPTSFFDKSLSLDDEEAEESETADMESILKLFEAKNCPMSMLRWHYRSRHHSLIAVSNDCFYGNNLVVFPSAGINEEAKGLSFHLNKENAYEKGLTRTNPGEARDIAKAVMEHAKVKAHLTLGVVAFSMAQRQAIEDQLEILRLEDSSCEQFFCESNSEPFFVKNLENVQGDERDVIFISVCYGRDTHGNVSKSFGPVNREGGERRLNVLISRARLEMQVYSNFEDTELDTSSTQSTGVKALKTFLKYARTGKLDEINDNTGREPDSPFEIEVMNELKAKGYDVVPQVGSAGFFIDIGVKHPDKPGAYVMGVECDGASYHSSKNARDRDRLKQSVLEGLGWNVFRIWSTDWFRNKTKELNRFETACSRAMNEGFVFKDLGVEPRVPKLRRESVSKQDIEESGLPAYQEFKSDLDLPYSDFHEIRIPTIISALRTIIEYEGPIHEKVLTKRILDSVGISRAGKRIQEHLRQAFKNGHIRGSFYRQNEFFYKDRTKTVSLRYWKDSKVRFEHISPEEVGLAIMEVIANSYSIKPKEACQEAVKLLGFKRYTEAMKDKVEGALQKLIDDGRIG